MFDARVPVLVFGHWSDFVKKWMFLIKFSENDILSSFSGFLIIFDQAKYNLKKESKKYYG